MELILERKFKKENYTIGNLYIASPRGGKEEASFFCNTLEPPVASEAEMRTAGSGKAIPPGTYQIKMHWSQRFQEQLPLLFTPGTNPPRVLGSPSRGGGGGRGSILIHAGNNPRDSTGCILVGRNTQVGRVVDSRKTLTALISKIRQAVSNGESIQITIN